MIAKLLEKRVITDRDTVYVFECPALAQKALPGQFVELKLTDGPDPFLRRPISIFDCDGKSEFSLLIRTVGYGTELMTRWQPGLEVDVLGPLGNGFRMNDNDQVCLLVGGGIGLAPLNYLARALNRQGKQIKLMFAPKRDADLLQSLTETEGLEIVIAENRKEIPAVLESALEGTDAVYACGPEGMLELTAKMTQERSIPCQLSMECRMACGIGICVGCAIAIRTESGLTYKKVCKDGPIFSGEEVSFHEFP